jgi:SAM-dependent methyltransferase
VNLLQPQDRRSLHAGDARSTVAARAALLGRGIGRVLIDAIADRIAHLALWTQEHVVVELGSGSGEALGTLAAMRPITGVGIDLSVAATAHAAQRFPALTWVVANADRRLPIVDRRVDVVLSIHARRNPAECRRILNGRGFLVIAVPAAEDLIELRETVQGSAVERDRVAALRAEHEPLFDVSAQLTCRQHLDLERDALLNLLRSTYRGERLSESPRVQRLERLTVTLASDILIFTPRP